MSIDILKPDLKQFGTARQGEYLDAVLEYGSATAASEVLGVNRRTVDRAISALKRAAIEAGAIEALDDHPKILLLDIETAPCMGNFWKMWDEVRTIDAILSDWYMLTVGYKWLGDPKITVLSQRNYAGYKAGSEDDRRMMEDVHKVLCEAEYVIAHNGDKFDIRKMNTRMLMNDLGPPTPFRTIDTLKIAKRIFGFTSNKLDFLAQVLLGERKMEHEGIELWQAVVRGEAWAWDKMEAYNEKDVDLLERVYLKLRSWDHLHPNVNLTTTTDNMSCTVCTSSSVSPTGSTVAVGAAGLYLGYVCDDCGHQMRGRTNIRTLNQKHSGLVNAK